MYLSLDYCAWTLNCYVFLYIKKTRKRVINKLNR